ncbi:hypothetical protein LJR034_005626 [Caballeronia sp. LjRoot34]|uniref:hypothetical protein n=1 Tax=Caballeronia sp. LjRoot34 TaxID=3342325 RepID=UPI003ECEF0B0
MRVLESVDHIAWTTCDRCGNTYSGSGQQCSRCGKTPTIMQRLANFSSPSNAKKGSSRGVSRRTRSRGTYPGLAETALLSDRASRRRTARIAFACAMGAGALIAYALTEPYLAGFGFNPQADETHLTATGPLVQSGPVMAQGNSVLPTQPSLLNGRQHASDETARTPQSDVSAFYHALQGGSLAVARRRLAGIWVSSEDSNQLEQMRTELASREHARDALLHHAWHCRALGDWQCVADSATQASAIDASSWEAKHLVARAAKETGKAHDE